MDEQSFRGAQEMFRKMSEDPERLREFKLLDREWDLLPGVFAPIYTPVTELFTTWLLYSVGGTSLRWAQVLASQPSSPRGVADQVRVLRSDLFTALRSMSALI